MQLLIGGGPTGASLGNGRVALPDESLRLPQRRDRLVALTLRERSIGDQVIDPSHVGAGAI
jgi:hypothetical protein